MDNYKSIRVHTDIDNLPTLQEFVFNTVKSLHIPEVQQGHLRLLVEELFINVCTHGQYATFVDLFLQKKEVTAQSQTLHIPHQKHKEFLHCIIVDNGTPFNPLLQNNPIDTSAKQSSLENIPLEDRAFGGVGLVLLQKLTHNANYSYANNENTLSFELCLNNTL